MIGFFFCGIVGNFYCVYDRINSALLSHRDEVTNAHLEALGWHVITVWECELRGKSIITSRLDALAEEIHEAGVVQHKQREFSKKNKREAKTALIVMMERQSQLEKEIDDLYPIPRRIKIESMTDE